MKAIDIVLKIVAALALIAGIAYVVVTYGDKIAAWFRKTFGCCCCSDDCCCDEDCCCEVDSCCEDAPAVETAPAEDAAEDTDFEG